MSTQPSAAKFDSARAAEYAEQSRIALAGYDACHELAACLLSSSLRAHADAPHDARILVAGAGGTAQEILTAAALEPGWRFTAVDPSPPMLDLARASVDAAGLRERVRFVDGSIDALPAGERYDAATLIGVLHHVSGDDAKAALLSAIAARMKPGAPFVLAGNYRHYASQPRLLAAWRTRWTMNGASADQADAKLAKILQGAQPPASEAAVLALLDEAGFDAPERFFSSLFWGAWIATRRAN